jgi:predicted amidohydrolase
MFKKQNIKISLAQINPRLADFEFNLDLHLKYIEKAVQEKSDIIFFPELSLSGYSLKDSVFDEALPVYDKKLRPLFEASKNIAVCFGMVELTDRFEIKNTQIFLENNKIAGKHRKVYLPTYGVFEEKRYFTPGNRFRAFDCSFGRSGIMICEDMWHLSSNVILSQDGALLFFVSAAGLLKSMQSKGKADNIQAWENLNSACAHNFTSYYIFCNRVGSEDGLMFWGGSEIVDPYGKIVIKAPYFEESFISAEIDMLKLKHARVHTTVVSDERTDIVIDELVRISKSNKEY